MEQNKRFASNIFNKFDYIYPQNNETTKYLKKFNVKNVKILGISNSYQPQNDFFKQNT